MELETVAVVNPKNKSSRMIINQSDYDKKPKAYTLWSARKPESVPEPSAPEPEPVPEPSALEPEPETKKSKPKK